MRGFDTVSSACGVKVRVFAERQEECSADRKQFVCYQVNGSFVMSLVIKVYPEVKAGLEKRRF